MITTIINKGNKRDLILNESELKEYKEYAREQQLLLEVSDYE